MLRLVAKRVLAHEIELGRLVCRGRQEGGLRQQLGLQRQQIAEDARQGDDHVDARAAELRERHQHGAGQPSEAVEPRPRADQGERLPDRPALALQVVGAPQDERDRLRERQPVRRRAARAAGPPAGRHRPSRRHSECGKDRSHGCCGPSAGWPACAADRRPAPGARSRRRAHARWPASHGPRAAAAPSLRARRSIATLVSSTRSPAPARAASADAPPTSASIADRATRTPWEASATESSMSTRSSDDSTPPTTCRPCGMRVASSSLDPAAEFRDVRCRRRAPGAIRSIAAAWACTRTAMSCRSSSASGGSTRQRSIDALRSTSPR